MPNPDTRAQRPSIADLNLLGPKNLGNPAVLATIPPLEISLERASGGDHSQLMQRIDMFGSAQIYPKAMLFMYNWLKQNQPNSNYRFTAHEVAYDFDEKSAVLETHGRAIATELGSSETPTPVKTLTVLMGDNPERKQIMVTMAGGRKFDNAAKREIGAKLGLSPKASKTTRIISSVLDEATGEFLAYNPAIDIGVMAGVVSPFVSTQVLRNYEGIFYLRSAQANPESIVEIAITPIESLFLRIDAFENMVQAYADSELNGLRRQGDRDFYVPITL